MNSSPSSPYFPTHTLETAPAAVRPLLAAQAAQFGFVPLPSARHATAPTVVEAFVGLLGAFERTSLSPLEREAVALALAGELDCAVCRTIHGGIARKVGAPPELVLALIDREGIEDTRLAELVRFVRDVLATRGAVTDESLARFVAAGFDAQKALEVVLGVATYTLSIFANRMTRAETLR